MSIHVLHFEANMFVARSASEVLDEIRRMKGLGSDAALGEVFGVRQSTVSSWRARNSLPYEEIIAFCVREGISTDNLLLHQGPVRITKVEIGTSGRPVTVTIEIDDLFITRLTRVLGERTVEWLAAEGGLDTARIEEIISGRELPTVDELESIADALKVSMIWLAQAAKRLFQRKFSRHTCWWQRVTSKKCKGSSSYHRNSRLMSLLRPVGYT
jgi:hypothetical protein